ncbi:GRF zinc finger containing protein, partial [Striga asiatica]
TSSFCGFFNWLDPEICARAKNIIPGLLAKVNKYEHEIEQYKIKESEAVFRFEVALTKLEDMEKELSAAIVLVKKLKKTIIFYLTIPGVRVHEDGGLVSVDKSYWQYVGEETDHEVFFRWNGFRWYNACVEVFDERTAAEIEMEGGPGTANHELINVDDIESVDDTDDDDME